MRKVKVESAQSAVAILWGINESYKEYIHFSICVLGDRQRGRQITRRKDSCKIYMESVELKKEDELDRMIIHNHSGDPG